MTIIQGNGMSIIIKDFVRPKKELINSFINIRSATAHAAYGNQGAVESAIKPLFPEMKILGTALTIKAHPGDNLSLHAGLQLSQPGDVLVVDTSNHTEQGVFGDMMAFDALHRGVAGLITNGSVRDTESIRALEFPVFSRSVAIQTAVKKTLGLINHPIAFGGVIINPGDLIIGDCDGVVVIAKEHIVDVLHQALQKIEKEKITREKIKNGQTLWEINDFNSKVKSLGYEEL
jgi:4-hydroxy-4-methyl-2-oxoglutarate aldolase